MIGYGLAAALAVAAGLVFLCLRPRYDALTMGRGRALDVAGALRLLRHDSPLRRLALAFMSWSALQMALNAFFVTFVVERLALPHVTVGLVLAGAQLAGLVGRHGWGLVATRLGAGPVIFGLGLAMGAAALAVSATGPAGPVPVLAGLAALLGFTASN